MSDSAVAHLRGLHARRRVARLREIEAAVRLEALVSQVDEALRRAEAGTAAVEQTRIRGMLSRRARLEEQQFTYRQERLGLDRQIRAATALVRRPLRVDVERADG